VRNAGDTARALTAVPLGEGFAPYRWSPSTADVARRHGVPPEHVLRYDQNTPWLPGVPQVPVGTSFSRLNEYPDGTYRALREAAAAYVGANVGWEEVIVGAGADDLILLCARGFLTAGSRAFVRSPTYALYAIATRLTGATMVADPADADLIWICNPNNPTGEVEPAENIVRLAQTYPDVPVVVDEAYVEFGADSVVGAIASAPNVIAVRTMSKAFGFASLRVGFAIASPDVAALLEERRAPAPISGPAAAIAAAALREPRLDIESVAAERDRMRALLVAAGYDVPESGANFVYIRSGEPLGQELERKGLVVREVKGGIRISVRTPTDDDVILRALGVDPPSPPLGRTATVVRTTTETALRIALDLDGNGRSRVVTGIGFLDHLLTLMSFHAGFDLELLAGGDVDVDEHHTVEDALAALGDALTIALGDRAAISRYGAATVPMDEARATAAVDLVRRPHAEVSLGFTGDRVGGLAVTLLPHALERFAMQAGCTVHVEASGTDDHHVAEAALKALGRALREACAPGDAGVRSTKGEA
jgi:histidinol-phosphate/aromatic aminotransferase/cobyric acid decarboxylase-like protein/imidazoleglycerol phosphate dehydratase HisB